MKVGYKGVFITRTFFPDIAVYQERRTFTIFCITGVLCVKNTLH